MNRNNSNRTSLDLQKSCFCVDWSVHRQLHFSSFCLVCEVAVYLSLTPLVPHHSGLFLCVQARAVSGIRGMLHVCSSEDAAQPVSRSHQDSRRLHLQTQLDHGQRPAQPSACHDLPQQGQVQQLLQPQNIVFAG